MLEWFFSTEKVRAKSIVDKGFTEGDFSSHEAQLVAKYAMLELNFGEAKAKTYLIDFCERNDADFNKILFRDKIRTIVKNAIKSGGWRDNSTPVIVFKSELDGIRNVRDFMAQKLMFILLVLSKKTGGYVYYSQMPEVRRILKNKNLNNTGLRRLIHLCYLEGLIKDSYENHFIKPVLEGVPKIVIYNLKDLYSLSEIYTKYCGGELSYCAVCGGEFVMSGRRDLYCTIHRKERKHSRRL